jgi:hypothetical protein
LRRGRRGADIRDEDTLGGGVGFGGPWPETKITEPFSVVALRGLFSLNTPVSAVEVLTAPFAPIRATTRGTVIVELAPDALDAAKPGTLEVCASGKQGAEEAPAVMQDFVAPPKLAGLALNVAAFMP